MPKVLILTGDAAEALEVIYPHQRLREEGYEVVVASLSRKLMQLVVHEMVPGNDTFVEKPGYHWPADVAFSEVDPSDYAAIVIPGGRRPNTFETTPTSYASFITSSRKACPWRTCVTPRSPWRPPAFSRVGGSPRFRNCSPTSRPRAPSS